MHDISQYMIECNYTEFKTWRSSGKRSGSSTVSELMLRGDSRHDIIVVIVQSLLRVGGRSHHNGDGRVTSCCQKENVENVLRVLVDIKSLQIRGVQTVFTRAAYRQIDEGLGRSLEVYYLVSSVSKINQM